LGTGSDGGANATADAINDVGLIVGTADKYASSTNRGSRAVRWDPTTLAATELGNLGTGAAGTTTAEARAVNNSGLAGGWATKYLGGTELGTRPVLWPAGGTEPVELATLGTNTAGVTNGVVNALDSSGRAAGYSSRFRSDGSSLGRSAVIWEPGQTAPTALHSFVSDPLGITSDWADGLNDEGFAVGTATGYPGVGTTGGHATLWDIRTGIPVDLNELIAPGSGWELIEANSINNAGQIAGDALFDADGPAGPLQPIYRAFLLTPVPEPAGPVLALASVALVPIRRRRRTGTRRHRRNVAVA
jgi:hypothetical protein